VLAPRCGAMPPFLRRSWRGALLGGWPSSQRMLRRSWAHGRQSRWPNRNQKMSQRVCRQRKLRWRSTPSRWQLSAFSLAARSGMSRDGSQSVRDHRPSISLQQCQTDSSYRVRRSPSPGCGQCRKWQIGCTHTHPRACLLTALSFHVCAGCGLNMAADRAVANRHWFGLRGLVCVTPSDRKRSRVDRCFLSRRGAPRPAARRAARCALDQTDSRSSRGLGCAEAQALRWIVESDRGRARWPEVRCVCCTLCA